MKQFKSQKGISIIILFFILGVAAGYLASQKATTSQEITQDSWYKYSNHQLGFSLRLPRYVVGLDRCNYHKFMVPLTVINDNKNSQIRIVDEYYYDTNYDKTGHQIIDGTCKKKVYTLASDQAGMLIRVEDVKNDQELVAFIKKTSGPGCGLIAKHESKIFRGSGVFDIETGPEGSNCNARDTILYSEGKQAMHSQHRQEAAFSGSYDNGIAYDFWILDGFRFEK